MTVQTATFHYVTYIRSTPVRVFEAITRPDMARAYWGHENISDWTPGSRWQHVRANSERTVELVGEVVEHAPPHRLVISWANASQADDASAYSRVTFDIVPYEDMVRLTVTHDGLIPGSGMLNGISKGWPIVLSSLKSYLETGQAMDVFAKPSPAGVAARGGPELPTPSASIDCERLYAVTKSSLLNNRLSSCTPAPFNANCVDG